MTKPKTKKRAVQPSRTRSGRPAPAGPARRPGLSPVVLAVLALAAAAGLGVALTRNTDHTSSGSGAFVGGDLHSLVAMPDGRVFVGGHDGVTVTRDGGRTWTQVSTLIKADAMGWGMQGRTVFVSGHPGLNRSDDNAVTFRFANTGLPDTDVHSFGAAAGVLYAAGPQLGVVASTDGGRTWKARSSDAGRAFFGRIVVDPADNQHLYAADVQSGPLQSRDGGRNWTGLGSGPAAWLSSPDGAGATLLASGGGEAARSTDGGRTWQALGLPAGALIVEAGPGDGQHLYAAGLDGSDARLWTSTDGGATWSQP